MVIQINVTDKRAVPVGSPVIVCGNRGYIVEFSFDKEWSEPSAKTARFVYVRAGAVHYQDIELNGNAAAVPVLSGVKEVGVGVFAGNRRTSTPVYIPCEPSICCP